MLRKGRHAIFPLTQNPPTSKTLKVQPRRKTSPIKSKKSPNRSARTWAKEDCTRFAVLGFRAQGVESWSCRFRVVQQAKVRLQNPESSKNTRKAAENWSIRNLNAHPYNPNRGRRNCTPLMPGTTGNGTAPFHPPRKTPPTQTLEAFVSSKAAGCFSKMSGRFSAA